LKIHRGTSHGYYVNNATCKMEHGYHVNNKRVFGVLAPYFEVQLLFCPRFSNFVILPFTTSKSMRFCPWSLWICPCFDRWLGAKSHWLARSEGQNHKVRKTKTKSQLHFKVGTKIQEPKMKPFQIRLVRARLILAPYSLLSCSADSRVHSPEDHRIRSVRGNKEADVCLRWWNSGWLVFWDCSYK